MDINAVHLFAPPLIGVFLTIISFMDDSLILRRVKKYLKGRVQPSVADQIEETVKGAIALAAFLAGTAVFWANLFLAFEIFPGNPEARLSLSIVDGILGLATFYAILHLFVFVEVEDIGNNVSYRMTWATWLKIALIGYNIFTLLYFYIGYRVTFTA
jgi:hypothetical protein